MNKNTSSGHQLQELCCRFLYLGSRFREAENSPQPLFTKCSQQARQVRYTFQDRGSAPFPHNHLALTQITANHRIGVRDGRGQRNALDIPLA